MQFIPFSILATRFSHVLSNVSELSSKRTIGSIKAQIAFNPLSKKFETSLGAQIIDVDDFQINLSPIVRYNSHYFQWQQTLTLKQYQDASGIMHQVIDNQVYHPSEGVYHLDTQEQGKVKLVHQKTGLVKCFDAKTGALCEIIQHGEKLKFQYQDKQIRRIVFPSGYSIEFKTESGQTTVTWQHPKRPKENKSLMSFQILDDRLTQLAFGDYVTDIDYHENAIARISQSDGTFISLNADQSQLNIGDREYYHIDSTPSQTTVKAEGLADCIFSHANKTVTAFKQQDFQQQYDYHDSQQLKAVYQNQKKIYEQTYSKAFGDIEMHQGMHPEDKQVFSAKKQGGFTSVELTRAGYGSAMIFDNHNRPMITISAAGRVGYILYEDERSTHYQFECFYHGARSDIEQVRQWIQSQIDSKKIIEEIVDYDKYHHEYLFRSQSGFKSFVTDPFKNILRYVGRKTYQKNYDSIQRCIENKNGFSESQTIYQENKMTRTCQNQFASDSFREEVELYANGSIASVQQGYKKQCYQLNTLGLPETCQQLADGEESLSRQFYDESGQIIGTIDQKGLLKVGGYDKYTRQLIVETLYDCQHLLSQQEWTLKQILESQPNQVQCQKYIYDDYQRLAYAIDAEGFVTAYEHDAIGNEIIRSRFDKKYQGNRFDYITMRKVLQSQSARYHYSFYDADQNKIGEIDERGYVTRYVLDGIGRTTRVERFAAKVCLDPQVKQSYAIACDLIKKQNGAVRQTSTFYQGGTLPFASVDAEGYVTTYQYNLKGSLVAEKYYHQSLQGEISLSAIQKLAQQDSSYDLTQYKRDLLSRIIEEIDPWGKKTTFVYYGESEKVVSKIEEDVNQYDDLFYQAKPRRTLYCYDEQGRCIQKINAKLVRQLGLSQTPYEEIDWAQHAEQGVRYAHNARGDCYQIINENQENIYQFFDTEGRLKVAIDCYGAITEYDYEVHSQNPAKKIVHHHRLENSSALESTQGYFTTEIENLLAENRQKSVSTWLMTYDSQERLLSQTDPLKRVESWQYNAHQELSEHCKMLDEKRTRVKTWRHDLKQEKISQTISQDDRTISHGEKIDAYGDVIESTDGNGNSYQFKHDRRGLVTCITAPDQTQTHQVWDHYKRILKKSYPLLATQEIAQICWQAQHQYDGSRETIMDSLNRVHIKIRNIHRELIEEQHASGLIEQTQRNKLGGERAFYQNSTMHGVMLERRKMRLDRSGQPKEHLQTETVAHKIKERQFEKITQQQKRVNNELQHALYQSWNTLGALSNQRIEYENEVLEEKNFSSNLAGQNTGYACQFDEDNFIEVSHKKDAEDKTVETEIKGCLESYQKIYGYDLFNVLISFRELGGALSRKKQKHTDNNSNVIAEGDFENHQIHYVYDNMDRIRFKISPAGEVTEWCYSAGSKLPVQKRLHDKAYRVPEDFSQLLTKVRLAQLEEIFNAGTNSEDYQLAEYAYDQGQRLQFELEQGKLREYHYDDHDKVTLQESYRQTFQSMSEVQQAFATQTLRQKSSRHKRSIRNHLGQVRFKIDARGCVTEYRYHLDFPKNITHVIHYDEHIGHDLQTDEAMTQRMQRCDLSKAHFSQKFYDNEGKKILTVDEYGIIEQTTYDRLDNEQSICTLRAPLLINNRFYTESELQHHLAQHRNNAHVTEYQRDRGGRILSQTENGVKTKYTFNCLSQRLVKLCEDLGQESIYDDLGRQIKTILKNKPVAIVTDKGDLEAQKNQLTLLHRALTSVEDCKSIDLNDAPLTETQGKTIVGDLARQVTYELNQLGEAYLKTTLAVAVDKSISDQPVDMKQYTIRLPHQRVLLRDNERDSEIQIYNRSGRVIYVLKPDCAPVFNQYNSFDEVKQVTQVNHKIDPRLFFQWRQAVIDAHDDPDKLVSLHQKIKSYCQDNYHPDHHQENRRHKLILNDAGQSQSKLFSETMRAVSAADGLFDLQRARESVHYHRNAFSEVERTRVCLKNEAGEVVSQINHYQRHFKKPRAILTIDEEGYGVLIHIASHGQPLLRFALAERIINPETLHAASFSEIETYFQTHADPSKDLRVSYRYDARNRLIAQTIHDEVFYQLPRNYRDEIDATRPVQKHIQDITTQYQYQHVTGKPLTWRKIIEPGDVVHFELLFQDEVIAMVSPALALKSSGEKVHYICHEFWQNSHNQLAADVLSHSVLFAEDGYPKLDHKGCVLRDPNSTCSDKDRAQLYTYNHRGDKTTEQNAKAYVKRHGFDLNQRAIRAWSYQNIMWQGKKSKIKQESIRTFDAAGHEQILYERVAGHLIAEIAKRAAEQYQHNESNYANTAEILLAVQKTFLSGLAENAKEIIKDAGDDDYCTKVAHDHSAFGELVAEISQQLECHQNAAGEDCYVWNKQHLLQAIAYDNSGFPYRHFDVEQGTKFQFADATHKPAVLIHSIKQDLSELNREQVIDLFKRHGDDQTASDILIHHNQHNHLGLSVKQTGPLFETALAKMDPAALQLVIDTDNESISWPDLMRDPTLVFRVKIMADPGSDLCALHLTALRKENSYRIDISQLDWGQYRYEIQVARQNPGQAEAKQMAIFKNHFTKSKQLGYFEAGYYCYLHAREERVFAARVHSRSGEYDDLPRDMTSTETKARFDLQGVQVHGSAIEILSERSLQVGQSLQAYSCDVQYAIYVAHGKKNSHHVQTQTITLYLKHLNLPKEFSQVFFQVVRTHATGKGAMLAKPKLIQNNNGSSHFPLRNGLQIETTALHTNWSFKAEQYQYYDLVPCAYNPQTQESIELTHGHVFPAKGYKPLLDQQKLAQAFPQKKYFYFQTEASYLGVYRSGQLVDCLPLESIDTCSSMKRIESSELDLSLQFKAVRFTPEKIMPCILSQDSITIKEVYLPPVEILVNQGLDLAVPMIDGKQIDPKRLRFNLDQNTYAYFGLYFIRRVDFQHGEAVAYRTYAYPRLPELHQKQSLQLEYCDAMGAWHPLPKIFPKEGNRSDLACYTHSSLQLIESLPESLSSLTVEIKQNGRWHAVEAVTVHGRTASFVSDLPIGCYPVRLLLNDQHYHHSQIHIRANTVGQALMAEPTATHLARKIICNDYDHQKRLITHQVNERMSLFSYYKRGGKHQEIAPESAMLVEQNEINREQQVVLDQQEYRNEAELLGANKITQGFLATQELPQAQQLLLKKSSKTYLRNIRHHAIGEQGSGALRHFYEVNDMGHVLAYVDQSGLRRYFQLNGFGEWIVQYLGEHQHEVHRKTNRLGLAKQVNQVRILGDGWSNSLQKSSDGHVLSETLRLGHILTVVTDEHGHMKVELRDRQGHFMAIFDDHCFESQFQFLDMFERCTKHIDVSGTPCDYVYPPVGSVPISEHEPEDSGIAHGRSLKRVVNNHGKALLEENQVEQQQTFFSLDGFGDKSGYLSLDQHSEVIRALTVLRNHRSQPIVVYSRNIAVEFYFNEDEQLLRTKLYLANTQGSFDWQQQDNWHQIESGQVVALNLQLVQGRLQPVPGRTIIQESDQVTGLLNKRIYMLEQGIKLEQSLVTNIDGTLREISNHLSELDQALKTEDLSHLIDRLSRSVDLRSVSVAQHSFQQGVIHQEMTTYQASGKKSQMWLANNPTIEQHDRDHQTIRGAGYTSEKAITRSRANDFPEQTVSDVRTRAGDHRETLTQTQCPTRAGHQWLHLRKHDSSHSNQRDAESEVSFNSLGECIAATGDLCKTHAGSETYVQLPDGPAFTVASDHKQTHYYALDKVLLLLLKGQTDERLHGEFDLGELRYHPLEVPKLDRDLIQFASVYHQVSADPNVNEDLNNIASLYGYPRDKYVVVAQAIAALNGLDVGARLEPGTRIQLPSYISERRLNTLLTSEPIQAMQLLTNVQPEYPMLPTYHHSLHHARLRNGQYLKVATAIAAAVASVMTGGASSILFAMSENLLDQTVDKNSHLQTGYSLKGFVTSSLKASISVGVNACADLLGKSSQFMAKLSQLVSAERQQSLILQLSSTVVSQLSQQAASMAINHHQHIDGRSFFLNIVQSALAQTEAFKIDHISTHVSLADIEKTGLKAMVDSFVAKAVDHNRNGWGDLLVDFAGDLTRRYQSARRAHQEDHSAHQLEIQAQQPRPDHPDLHVHGDNVASSFLDLEANEVLENLGFMDSNYSTSSIQMQSMINPQLLYHYTQQREAPSHRFFAQRVNDSLYSRIKNLLEEHNQFMDKHKILSNYFSVGALPDTMASIYDLLYESIPGYVNMYANLNQIRYGGWNSANDLHIEYLKEGKVANFSLYELGEVVQTGEATFMSSISERAKSMTSSFNLSESLSGIKTAIKVSPIFAITGDVIVYGANTYYHVESDKTFHNKEKFFSDVSWNIPKVMVSSSAGSVAGAYVGTRVGAVFGGVYGAVAGFGAGLIGSYVFDKNIEQLYEKAKIKNKTEDFYHRLDKGV